jgi:hypothetical protein
MRKRDMQTVVAPHLGHALRISNAGFTRRSIFSITLFTRVAYIIENRNARNMQKRKNGAAQKMGAP